MQQNDPLIGKQLGDYRLTSLLSIGGMARIYAGMDYNLDRQAAVKVLEAGDYEEMTARFQKEARAIAALRHRHIVTLYQYGRQDNLYYMAMEYVQGDDLAQELRALRDGKQQMERERWLTIMEQIASAIDYAHHAGVIHRDIKPSNILIDNAESSLRAVLTDFGLVLRPSDGDSMGTAFGTPRYISPEQAIASDKAVPQSDIYSFAVVLYEILTGEPPFTGESLMSIALSHITDPPPPPRSKDPTIPERVEQEILRALDKNPENRQATASAFIQAVKAGYDDLPVRYKTAPSASAKMSPAPVTRQPQPPQPSPKPTRSPSVQIFVSYSTRNRSEMEKLVRQLKYYEYKVWYDDELKTQGGQQWWENILSQVRANDLFIFTLSPESLLSFPCYLEYTYAHELGKWVLPVKALPFEIPLLPPALKALQVVDFTSHDASKRLDGSIRDLMKLPPRPAATRPPEEPPVPWDDFTDLGAKILNIQQNLSEDEQLVILGKLEDLLHLQRTEKGALILLKLLVERRDLLASAGRKLDRILQNAAPKPGLINRFLGRRNT